MALDGIPLPRPVRRQGYRHRPCGPHRRGRILGHSMQMLCGRYLHQQTRRRYIPRHLGQALRNRIRHDGIRTAAVDLNDEQMELHGRADDPQSESSGNATEPYRPRKRRCRLEQSRTGPLRRGLPVQTLCHTGAPAGGHRPGPRLFQDRRSHRPTRPYARQTHHGLRHGQNLRLAANCRERNRRPRSGAVPRPLDCAFGTNPAVVAATGPGADDGCLHLLRPAGLETDRKEGQRHDECHRPGTSGLDRRPLHRQATATRPPAQCRRTDCRLLDLPVHRRHFAGPAAVARRDRRRLRHVRSHHLRRGAPHHGRYAQGRDRERLCPGSQQRLPAGRAPYLHDRHAAPLYRRDEETRRRELRRPLLDGRPLDVRRRDLPHRLRQGRQAGTALRLQGPHPRRGRKGHYPHAAKRTDPRGRNHRRG